ncbi:MAG: hypothetical protein IKQ91_11460 [Oscillospiraceae bacterium]|nr:hypothetical protein [Oscillospiraceae bacterium]
MKYTCPHCGNKTFTPLRKALCGGLSSSGKPCPECGGRCVNGKLSLLVNTVLRLTALIMIIRIYFKHTTLTEVFWYGVVPMIAAYVIGFLFDMFFGKLTEAIKRQ